MRYRPHRPVPNGPYPPLELQAALPLSPPPENVLQRLGRPSVTRWDGYLDDAERPHVHHRARRQYLLSPVRYPDSRIGDIEGGWRTRGRPRVDDAAAETNTRAGATRPHRCGTTLQRAMPQATAVAIR